MVEGAAVLGDESLLGWDYTHTHTAGASVSVFHWAYFPIFTGKTDKICDRPDDWQTFEGRGCLISNLGHCSPTFPVSVFCCRKMLKLCGETQDKLAQELILFEFTIERDVIEPLSDLSEVRWSRSTYRTTHIERLRPQHRFTLPLFAYICWRRNSPHIRVAALLLLCFHVRNNSSSLSPLFVKWKR